LKRKFNLLDDKQKREIISYAKENPKLTQQQIVDNLTIKWDLPIKRRTRNSNYMFLFVCTVSLTLVYI
jgi:ABC-type iron transport system FetAB ATPase subunit